MPQVGIVGASGFTGAELMRLCAAHADLEVAVVTGDTQAGRPVADLYPGLAAGYGDLGFEPYTPDLVDGLDAVFLGLPHGASRLGCRPKAADLNTATIVATYRIRCQRRSRIVHHSNDRDPDRWSARPTARNGPTIGGQFATVTTMF